ncbi:hypothetical protein BD626DRAFT_394532 [Schizophyllum amplum]|uniref:Uncharacterized protein n=1 Tax=Schizophyllum amplum TaxID=97359 RepID=A0A550CU81_9AGAR|nr:hypothetical protein BD626DRAFT_394532 [Auriculariopsis ampla]
MRSTILLTAALSLVSGPSMVMGRMRWFERDDKPVFLHPRRFGQEQPAVIQKLASACDGAVCGVLSGQAVSPLLAAQGECTQQDMADAIIDASRQFDEATQTNMIAIAQEYRQVEKNTPPDFTTNPPTNRNSVYCQKAPANAELAGLVQAQDPANDPELFFDPATKATVNLGDQANTTPFDDASSSATRQKRSTKVVARADSVGTFGSCTKPEITFGTGFDGRTESSFRTGNRLSYDRGSALNIDTVTTFICDALQNTCGADATAIANCAKGAAAAKKAATGTGAQADAFNAVFGLDTNFSALNAVPVSGSATNAAAAAVSTTKAASSAATAGSTSGTDFGTCSTPQIEFGQGFDGRRETSFQPVDKNSFNHGSAQAIDIISQFVCDQLTNSCKANQAAKDLCQQARTAADGAAAKTGAQADAFNAVMGISTNFASVGVFDDQGRPVSS